MKHTKTTLTTSAVGIALAAILALTGCTGSHTNTTQPAPSHSAVATPKATPTQPAAPKVGQTIDPGGDQYKYAQGDVEVSGNTIKTANGSYMPVQYKDGSVAYTGKNNDTAALAQYGYTTDDAKAAQEFALNYLGSDFIDSPVLAGSESDYDTYITSLVNKGVVNGAYVATTNKPSTKNPVAFVFSNPELQFVNDGGAHVNNATFNVINITASKGNDGKTAIGVQSSIAVTYRIDGDKLITLMTNLGEASAIPAQVKSNPDTQYEVTVSGQVTEWLQKDGTSFKVDVVDGNFNFTPVVVQPAGTN